jgi:hypothetical protein
MWDRVTARDTRFRFQAGQGLEGEEALALSSIPVAQATIFILL